MTAARRNPRRPAPARLPQRRAPALDPQLLAASLRLQRPLGATAHQTHHGGLGGARSDLRHLVGGQARRAIAAGLADRGQYLGRDPLLEAPRRRLAAGQDQAVEAGFADDDHLLVAARGADSIRTLLILIQSAHGIIGPPDLQDARHVGGDEPRLAVAGEVALAGHGFDELVPGLPAYLAGMVRELPEDRRNLLLLVVGFSDREQRARGFAYASGEGFEPRELAGNCWTPSPDPDAPGHARLRLLSERAAVGHLVPEFHLEFARNVAWSTAAGHQRPGFGVGGPLVCAKVARDGATRRQIGDLGQEDL